MMTNTKFSFRLLIILILIQLIVSSISFTMFIFAENEKSKSNILIFTENNHLTYSIWNYENVKYNPDKPLKLTFNSNQQRTVSMLYDYKYNPPYKNPAWAGIFSAIIPGSGKMYVGEWGDGITGLLITSLFAFLAYDNFKANHNTRAWIFTGIGTFFYAGNIYGSIASAKIFNARIDFEFKNGLKLFLEKENYFLPEYEFCN